MSLREADRCLRGWVSAVRERQVVVVSAQMIFRALAMLSGWTPITDVSLMAKWSAPIGMCLHTSDGVESFADDGASSNPPRRCSISSSSTPLDLRKSILVSRGAVLTASSSRNRRATSSLSVSLFCCDCDASAAALSALSLGALSCHLGTPSGDDLPSESSICAVIGISHIFVGEACQLKRDGIDNIDPGRRLAG